MKRILPGLSATAASERTAVPDGRYLARVESAQQCWHAKKPFCGLRFSVLEPKEHAGAAIIARLYCTSKAMWKLGWFLRDFQYDPSLLSSDELDERALRGLIGVLQISHTIVNGVSLVNLDGFAPASQWAELSQMSRIPSTAISSGRANEARRA